MAHEFDPEKAIYIIVDYDDDFWVVTPDRKALEWDKGDGNLSAVQELCHMLHPDRAIVTLNMPVALGDVIYAQDEEDAVEILSDGFPLPNALSLPLEASSEGELIEALLKVNSHIFGEPEWRDLVTEVWEPHTTPLLAPA